MRLFWRSLGRRLIWLLVTPWPYVWKAAKWVGDNFLGDVVVSWIKATWEALPDAGPWLLTMADWPVRYPATVAVITAAIVVALSAVMAAREAQRRTNVQTSEVSVEPHGGPDATLVVRNKGVTARFNGDAEFVTDGCKAPIQRQRPFRVMWQQPSGKTDFDNIGSGDFGTVVLFEVSYGTAQTSVHIAAWGDGGGVQAWEFPMKITPGVFPNLRTVRIRVTLRAQPPLKQEWSGMYDVTWDGKKKQFKIAEVAP